ncbi:MAG: hypothetical protein KC417_11385, partial [Myxococcales bacterium]|nr:hypothetical protein [Myxococcales bacterium]
MREWVATVGTALFIVVLTAWMPACSSDGGGGVPDEMDSGFDFSTEALTFTNFTDEDPTGSLKPALVARMFGEDKACVDGKLPCVLTDFARAWVDDVNRTLAEGRSEGFALTTLLFHTGELDTKDFGADTAAELVLAGNQPLRDELAYWAATQKVPSTYEGDKRFAAKDVMPFLAKALAPNATERYRLAIAIKTENGFERGHGLVPIGYYRVGEKKYVLRVYDNNLPQSERNLEIDVAKNTWRYEAPVGETPLVYEGNTENKNVLYFAPLSKRMGTLAPPFGDDTDAIFASSAGAIQVAVMQDGAATGIVDGEVVEGPGGVVQPAFATCPICKASSGILNIKAGWAPLGQTEIAVSNGIASGSGMEKDGATVNIAHGYTTTTLKGIKGDANTQTTLTLDNKTGNVTLKTASMEPVDITHTAGGVVTHVVVAGGATEVKVGVDDKGRPVIDTTGVPAGTTVTVEVET